MGLPMRRLVVAAVIIVILTIGAGALVSPGTAIAWGSTAFLIAFGILGTIALGDLIFKTRSQNRE